MEGWAHSDDVEYKKRPNCRPAPPLRSLQGRAAVLGQKRGICNFSDHAEPAGIELENGCVAY